MCCVPGTCVAHGHNQSSGAYDCKLCAHSFDTSHASAIANSVPWSERHCLTAALTRCTVCIVGPYSSYVWWTCAWSLSGRLQRPCPSVAKGQRLSWTTGLVPPASTWMIRSTEAKTSVPICGDALYAMYRKSPRLPCASVPPIEQHGRDIQPHTSSLQSLLVWQSPWPYTWQDSNIACK